MASDSFVGEALMPSPYSELRAKYEVILAQNLEMKHEFTRGAAALEAKYSELRAWADDAVLYVDDYCGGDLTAKYSELRTKHDRTP